jgi:ABC-type sugar transport system ATPase subunit
MTDMPELPAVTADGNGSGPGRAEAPGAGPPRLRLEGITKAYGNVTVLHDVSLELARGEIHGLLGQNGAGKSTLTRVLAGGATDYKGTIELDGNAVHLRGPQESQRQGIAVIYQEFSLVPQLTVAQNIMLGAEPGRMHYSARACRRRAAALVERIGMADEVPLDAAVGGLSTSMQQRVEIAKALSRDARVLVLDEPTSRLGTEDREQLFELMRRIAANGTSLIFISHFLEEVLAVTSAITVLRDGRVVERGRSAEYTPATVSTALLGEVLEEQQHEESLQKVGALGEVILKVDNLGCGHRVRGVSFALRSGEIVALAGLIGSGRTTLAKALVGALPMTAGEVSLHGDPVSFRSPTQALRAGVALVPEDRRAQGLVGVLPADENITLMKLIRQKSPLGLVGPSGLRRAAQQAVKDFEVRPAEGERPAAMFSGGNQQKLLIARTVLSDAEVLIIDQPTAGVDVGTKAQIHRILRSLADDGKAILVLSDEIEELLGLGDRILVMRDGALVSEHVKGSLGQGELNAAMAARSQAVGG